MGKHKAKQDVTPILQVKDVVRDRWHVLEEIGAGGFGQIYRARDTKHGDAVAIKTERNGPSVKKCLIKMEVAALKRLAGQPCVPQFLGCGRDPTFNFLVMSLVGKNLSRLRKERPNRQFSLPTVCEIGRQAVRAIQAVHEAGILHRDVKPSNFAVGLEEASQTIVILDFGLARLYQNDAGQVRRPRNTVPFRGTVRYASINAHLHRELARRDDLWSLACMLVEMSHGSLPWSRIQDRRDTLDAKQATPLSQLASDLPRSIRKLISHVDSLKYEDQPDYDMLADAFDRDVQSLLRSQPFYFDWELDGSPEPSLTTTTEPEPLRGDEAGNRDPGDINDQRRSLGQHSKEQGGGTSNTAASTQAEDDDDTDEEAEQRNASENLSNTRQSYGKPGSAIKGERNESIRQQPNGTGPAEADKAPAELSNLDMAEVAYEEDKEEALERLMLVVEEAEQTPLQIRNNTKPDAVPALAEFTDETIDQDQAATAPQPALAAPEADKDEGYTLRISQPMPPQGPRPKRRPAARRAQPAPRS